MKSFYIVLTLLATLAVATPASEELLLERTACGTELACPKGQYCCSECTSTGFCTRGACPDICV